MKGSGRLFGILCGCLCLAAADAFSPQAAGALPGSSPPPTVAKTFFPAPQNCPRGDANLTHRDGPQSSFFHIGSPALIGFSAWEVSHGHVTLRFGVNPTRFGYPQKIFWQLTPHARGPVTLRGWNLRTGQRIWFGHPLPAAPSNAVVPVIAWPAGLVRHHRAPTLTFIPSAGCYVIRARGTHVDWSISFAAGA